MANRWQNGVITMPKGTMTLDKLAGMVQQGFTSMDESMNGRIGALEKSMGERFEGVHAELSAIRRQLHQAVYQNEFDALERRVEILEQQAGIHSK